MLEAHLSTRDRESGTACVCVCRACLSMMLRILRLMRPYAHCSQQRQQLIDLTVATMAMKADWPATSESAFPLTSLSERSSPVFLGVPGASSLLLRDARVLAGHEEGLKPCRPHSPVVLIYDSRQRSPGLKGLLDNNCRTSGCSSLRAV